MTIVLIYKALLVICCIRQVESGISLIAYSSIENTQINSLNVVVDIECNSNFSLVCEVKPYINSATWQINGENAALCISTSCFENLPFPEYHTFSMNTSSGDFIMSVSPVTNDTNGNIYKCDDSHTALSVIPVIKVLPTSETLKIDNSVKTKITVSTGCVYPKKETDLDFDWFISKNKVNPFKEESLSTISSLSTVNECTETNCAGLDTAYFNTTVEFEVYDEGESYYICVKVTHIDAKSRPAEICSDRQYQVLKKSKQGCNLIICILVIILVRVYALQDLLTAFYVVRERQHAVDEQYKLMKFLASFPLFGFIFPAVTVVYEHMKDKTTCIILIFITISTFLLPCIVTLTPLCFVLYWESLPSWFGFITESTKRSFQRAKYFVLLMVLVSLVIESLEYALLSCTEVFRSTAAFWSINILYIIIFVVCLHSLFTMAYKIHETNLKIDTRRQQLNCVIVCCNTGSAKVNICKQCFKYVCVTCAEKHGFLVLKAVDVLHAKDEIRCKACSAKRLVECLNAHNELVCSECLDKEERLERNFFSTFIISQRFRNILVYREYDCCKNGKKDVCCLICGETMCKQCFLEHRQKHWNQGPDRSHMQALCHCPIFGLFFACHNFYQREKKNKVQQQSITCEQ